MRFVVVLVIGILVGAITATTAAAILGQRHAYPRALMRVMQVQFGAARDAARDAACNGNETRLAILDLLAADIGRAIPHGDPPDRVFGQYVDGFRRDVADARGAAGDCKAQADALTRVANACADCHRDYR